MIADLIPRHILPAVIDEQQSGTMLKRMMLLANLIR
jgi:hypothetical protein